MKRMRYDRVRGGLAIGMVGAIVGLGLASGCTSSGRYVSREQTLVSNRAAGDEAYRRGEYNQAAGFYERYLEERPARREVMYDLGRAYEGMGEMSAAREAYTLAYELDPFNVDYIDAMARSVAANALPSVSFRSAGSKRCHCLL